MSGPDDYMKTGFVTSTEGALAGAAFCMMTGVMLTRYTATFTNMEVKVNDSVARLTENNIMADAMGQENYQLVKDVPSVVSDGIFTLGLLNLRLYGPI